MFLLINLIKIERFIVQISRVVIFLQFFIRHISKSR